MIPRRQHLLARQDTTSVADDLEALFQSLYGLAEPAQIPVKLGLGASWPQLLAHLRTGQGIDAPLAPLLITLYGAARSRGAADRYLQAFSGVRLPLRAAGVAWQRLLGPYPAGGEAFDHALSKLRWEAHGLHLKRRVGINGQPVEWAIAGLLPTGQALRVAVRVRPAPTPHGAMAEDLADDAVAAAGFEVLGLREWQLRYAGACALEVAAYCRSRAPHLGFPAKLHDPDDDHPLHRLQAAPAVLTPREATPHWAQREAARAGEGGVGKLLERYRNLVIGHTRETAEDEDDTVSKSG